MVRAINTIGKAPQHGIGRPGEQSPVRRPSAQFLHDGTNGLVQADENLVPLWEASAESDRTATRANGGHP